MERDAPPSVEVVPPVAWETARSVGLAGAGLAGAAAAVGLAGAAVDLPWVASTARLLLVFAGAVTTGLAVSFRPDRWQAWAIGAATASLAHLGTPPHWDSFRFLFTVMAGVAVVFGLLRVLPAGWRLAAVTAYTLFHFFGIFLATVSPPPSPWLVEQLYTRAYNPYLQFLYLRNAYHFYSPEPGPASLLACLIKTEVGEEVTADGVRRPKYEMKWVVLPKRPADIRDPMGLTYYRRLSLTEQVARGLGDYMLPENFEKSEVHQRRILMAQPGRGDAAYFPLHPAEPDVAEYKLPTPDVTRYILPSYAQHLILEHTPDKEAAARTTVKVYRVEHKTLGVREFTGSPGRPPVDPYDPTTYRPFFLGEFDGLGNLVDPKEPMLYWLVPVLPKPPGPADKRAYKDYMSLHAGLEFDWGQFR